MNSPTNFYAHHGWLTSRSTYFTLPQSRGISEALRTGTAHIPRWIPFPRASLSVRNHTGPPNLCLSPRGGLSALMDTDCFYVQFVYILCTFFRVISYNYQRVTASNMYNCLQAYFFGISTKSKNRNNRIFFNLRLAIATAPACEFYSS